MYPLLFSAPLNHRRDPTVRLDFLCAAITRSLRAKRRQQTRRHAQPPTDSDRLPEPPSKTTIPAFGPFAPGENVTWDTFARMPMDQSTPGSWMPRKCCRKGHSATINMGADSSRHLLRMVKASSSVTTTSLSPIRDAIKSAASRSDRGLLCQ